MKDYFADLYRRSPVRAVALAAVAILFVADTGMSIVGGYRKAGGDMQPAAFGYALIMLALAMLASWAPWQAERERGAARLGLWVLSMPLFLLMQANGWAVMGVTMADGAVKRDTAATSRTLIDEKLGRLRAEAAKIGTQRPVAEVKPLEARECKLAPRGVDPVQEKCTKLRAELGKAERLVEIDREIAEAAQALGKAPKVAGGGADRVVLIALVDGVRGWWRGEPLTDEQRSTAADIDRGWSIFIVAVVGFFAVFGPAIVLPPHGRGEPEPEADDGRFDPRALPAPPRRDLIAAPQTAASENSGPPRTPLSIAHAQCQPGGHGGGATNIINVGREGAMPMPPRIAARRAALAS
jgi:hypothetical protein